MLKASMNYMEVNGINFIFTWVFKRIIDVLWLILLRNCMEFLIIAGKNFFVDIEKGFMRKYVEFKVEIMGKISVKVSARFFSYWRWFQDEFVLKFRGNSY